MNLPSNTLRDAKRLFGRLRHLRCKLPVLNHLLLTAGPDGIHLAASDSDHWLETRISDLPVEPARFLIPPAAMDAACRADKGTTVAFEQGGRKRSPEIRVTLQSGGISSTSVHPTLDPGDFPERPLTAGITTELPPATLRELAGIIGCAATDPTRQVLNGVFFTPGDGGRLVATDGRRLACCPAIVPSQEFIAPLTACHILGHRDFLSDAATVTRTDHPDPEQRHIAIRCGRHQLVFTPLAGDYPDYKMVIPTDATHLAVIPHDRRPGLIAWLRSLGKGQRSVRLDWQKRGQLTLSHRDPDGHSASMRVPVEIHGQPPVIAFDAHYLADGLEIGGTLCLSDDMSPGICRHPTGRFCVIMPLRLAQTAPPEAARQADPHPLGQEAA